MSSTMALIRSVLAYGNPEDPPDEDGREELLVPCSTDRIAGVDHQGIQYAFPLCGVAGHSAERKIYVSSIYGSPAIFYSNQND